jgi:hypothetical protein
MQRERVEQLMATPPSRPKKAGALRRLMGAVSPAKDAPVSQPRAAAPAPKQSDKQPPVATPGVAIKKAPAPKKSVAKKQAPAPKRSAIAKRATPKKSVAKKRAQ